MEGRGMEGGEGGEGVRKGRKGRGGGGGGGARGLEEGKLILFIQQSSKCDSNNY